MAGVDHAALADVVFGDRVGLARRYRELLATEGIERGLIGPREADRLWERHLLNCAVITDLLPIGARIVDVGSGAGLPGLALAIRRPDLRVDLVESLRRRTDFLTDAVVSLELGETVRVVRGRAEQREVVAAVGESDWVTARAVAPLDRLVGWCLPLLRPGGHLLALKGSSATEEIAQYEPAAQRAGVDAIDLIRCGSGTLVEPTIVVSMRRAGTVGPQGKVRS